MKFQNFFDFVYFSKDDRELLLGEAVEAEKAGRLTNRQLEMAYSKRLFHLLVPQSMGGHQLSLPEALHCFEEASYLDGSLGWLLTLGAGAGMFSAYIDPLVSEKIFKDPKTFISGSGFPAGTATPYKDGYRISGNWKYISGWPHATLFTASCLIKSDNGDHPDIKAFAFLPEQVEIQERWNSHGLIATASDNMKVVEQFVPEGRTFLIAPEASHIDADLYRFPFEPFARCTLAISLLGMAERFVDEAGNIIYGLSDGDGNDAEKMASLHEESFRALRDIRDELYGHMEVSWNAIGEDDGRASRRMEKIKELAALVNHKALQAAHRIYPHLGMQVLDRNKAVNRAWRDLHTASQHTFLTPEI